MALRTKLLILDPTRTSEQTILDIKKSLLARPGIDPQSILPEYFPKPPEQEAEEIEKALSGEQPSEITATIDPDEALALLTSMRFDTGTLGPDDLRTISGNDNPWIEGT